MVNPFLQVEQAMASHRNGDSVAEALMLLAPAWSSDWTDDGTPAREVILAKLNECPKCSLVESMKVRVNGLPI